MLLGVHGVAWVPPSLSPSLSLSKASTAWLSRGLTVMYVCPPPPRHPPSARHTTAHAPCAKWLQILNNGRFGMGAALTGTMKGCIKGVIGSCRGVGCGGSCSLFVGLFVQ